MRPQALDGLVLVPHHRRAIERLCDALEPDVTNRALLLGGSLAHGFGRPESDVDVQVLVGHAEMERRRRDGKLTWSDGAGCDWAGGYVDVKYLDLELLEQVAIRGSEPARYAFQGARILFSRSDGLDDILGRVARYPREGRDDRVARFAAQLLAWRWYHSEGLRLGNDYLATLARQKVTLFACRIVLARNDRLYPFHKWMIMETAGAPDRPPTLLDDIDRMLHQPGQARVVRVVSEVLDWYGIDEATADATWPSRYMEDTELAWLRGQPAIDDL